jgi:nucleoside-diphosphate-sugar epimerase
MRKHAFVTGINGFTGYYLRDELVRREWTVSGLIRPSEVGATSPPDEFSVADLNDEKRLQQILSARQPSVVVHLAAVANVAHGDVSEIYQTNLVGSRALLSSLATMQKKPSAVLLVSSANVYGNSDREVLSEHHIPRPANDYGVSKLAMEFMAHTWGHMLPITVVRPFNYTGRGQSTSFVIPKIVDHFRRKTHQIELGNIDVFRDYSDVRDVVNAYCDLLESPQAGKTFNVASGRARSLREIVATLSELTGFYPELVTNPNFVRKNEIVSLRGDASALRAVAPSFRSRDFRETLAWMLDDVSIS